MPSPHPSLLSGSVAMAARSTPCNKTVAVWHLHCRQTGRLNALPPSSGHRPGLQASAATVTTRRCVTPQASAITAGTRIRSYLAAITHIPISLHASHRVKAAGVRWIRVLDCTQFYTRTNCDSMHRCGRVCLWPLAC
jgi:hypothetical protein